MPERTVPLSSISAYLAGDEPNPPCFCGGCCPTETGHDAECQETRDRLRGLRVKLLAKWERDGRLTP